MLWGKKEWQQASTIGFAGWEEETGIESFTELPAPDHEGLCEESESPSVQESLVWKVRDAIRMHATDSKFARNYEGLWWPRRLPMVYTNSEPSMGNPFRAL